MIGIYGIDIEKNNGHIRIPILLRYVSPGKKHRINAYRDLEEAKRVLVADLLVRAAACRYLNITNDELRFGTNQFGKPYLEGVQDWHFNTSHSGRWVVCAVDREPVGIDVEKIEPIEMDIARVYFSPDELTYIVNLPENKRTAAFYDIWTLKESFIKALGHGLSMDLKSFTVGVNGKVRSCESIVPDPVFLRQYEIDQEYRLSLCAFNDDFPEQVEIVDMKWIIDALA